MSRLNKLQTNPVQQLGILLCFGLASFAFLVQTGFSQAVLEIEEGITLGSESIFGEPDKDKEDQTLARLVDKSTIADLKFLNSGEAPTSIEQLKAMQAHVASLYQRVEPAVVNIQSGMGQGSGVVVTSDGYVLTAAHVISIPNRSALITFPDGTRAKAQTLGLFRELDAGLLKIYEMVPEDGDDEQEAADEQAAEDAEDRSDTPDDNRQEDSKAADEPQDAESNDAAPADEGTSEDNTSDDDTTDEAEEEKEAQGDSEKSDEGDRKKSRFEVQTDLPSFSYLDIGDSGQLSLGQWVIAVGHPGGMDTDRGIVLRVGRINEIEIEQDDAYVRTDCTLVGGDSGGPLIGMDGSVIGIHSRIGMRLKQNFHVPSNEYIDNWTSLLEPVVHDRTAQLNIRFRGRTNVIESVPRRSLAARSGLRASDRIIRIGDREIFDKLQFDDAISGLKPYEVVEFEVRRKGKKKIVEVTVGEKSELFGRR